MDQQIGARPVQPWGDNPPPVPATATRAQRNNVTAAWSAWSHFRPWYTRNGNRIEAEINLKDNIWRGTGTGPTEADAAWAALQDCIDTWRADVAVHLVPKSVRDWLRRLRCELIKKLNQPGTRRTVTRNDTGTTDEPTPPSPMSNR